MGDWYEHEARELIKRAEARSNDTLEEFYRGLKTIVDEVSDRLETAREELPAAVANDILGIDGTF